MKRSLFVIATLATLAIPAVVSAIPARPGAYVSGFAGASFVRNTDATTNDFFTPATFNDRIEFDPSINMGATGGYDFGFVRFEGELSYKRGEISSVTSQVAGTNAVVSFTGTDGSLGAFAFMGNMFLDLHNQSPITPYLGGGIGFATLYLDDTSGINTSTGLFSPLYTWDDDTVFAYQAGAGLEIALNRQFSLDLGYRYFATENARFDRNPALTSRMKFESHNGAVGFRVKF